MNWINNSSIYDTKPDDFKPVMLHIDGVNTMGYYWQYAKRFYCYKTRFDHTRVSKWRHLTDREWLTFQLWQNRHKKKQDISQPNLFKAA